MKEECPLAVVQCELHHAGCEVTLPCKDMAEHMKEDSIAHISLLVHELTQTKQELTHTKQELTQTKQELTHTKQELTQTKQELTQKVATQELTRFEQELTQKITQGQELETKLRETQLQAIDQLQIQQQRELQELRAEIEMQRDIPVTIKMAGFDTLKKKGTDWHSRPFYTGRGGYKMCLSVHANGCGAGKGTHASVHSYLSVHLPHAWRIRLSPKVAVPRHRHHPASEPVGGQGSPHFYHSLH